jgi:hypothetical protein
MGGIGVVRIDKSETKMMQGGKYAYTQDFKILNELPLCLHKVVDGLLTQSERGTIGASATAEICHRSTALLVWDFHEDMVGKAINKGGYNGDHLNKRSPRK